MLQTSKIVLIAAITACIPAMAQAAETPEHSVTGNAGIFSNYVFRGVTQTSEQAALQGGFDYAHKSGVYAGVWGSNISWLSDSAFYTASSLEMDFYGGYKGTIGSSGFGYDVGAIVYYYPGDKVAGADNANTGEVYVGFSWKWIAAKLSYAATEYFGFVDSKGTIYADLSANYPIAKTGLTAQAHIGSVMIAGDSAAACTVVAGGPTCSNDDAYSYTDWKLGVSYALPKDFTVGAFYADTNGKVAAYTILGNNWAEKQAGIFVSKTF
jgi:uncharacterized protein (TIGR02001 family)